MNIIFPAKSDYLNDYDFNDLEYRPKKSCYTDYIIQSNNRPNEFYHCFSSKFDSGEGDAFTHWHFGILIIFEEIKLNESNKDLKKNYYAAKGIIIVSTYPYYILFKNILQDLYKKYYESPDQPLELYIINIFTLLKLDKNKSNLIQFLNNEYFIAKDPLLPHYDFNLSCFFNKFNIDDYLIICEHFLKRWPIIMLSQDLSILYPTYYTIMTLLYPLDITNSNDYYKYLIPSVFSVFILGTCAPFVCINSAPISDNNFKKIVHEKGIDTLAIYLDSPPHIKLFNYNKDDINIIKGEELYKRSIIIYTWEKNINDDILITLIENDINQLLKLANENNFLHDYYRYIHYMWHKKQYDISEKIRKQLFSLISKFIAFCIPYTNLEIDGESNKIKINFDNNIEDVMLKDFFSYFITTPSFNIVYKFNVKADDSNLKNLIMLEELIRILKEDKNRLYFDALTAHSIDLSIINTIKITEKSIYFNLGSKYKGFHIYNINLLRNNNLSYAIEELGQDDYLIRYKYLELYFPSFEKFINQSNYITQLNLLKLNNPNNNKENFDILLYEIKVFIHLAKTSTLSVYITKLILTVIYIVLLSIQIFSLKDIREDSYSTILNKKMKLVFDQFENTDLLKHFGFLYSILYEIIQTNNTFKASYEKDFFEILVKQKFTPTFNIYIKANKIISINNKEDFYNEKKSNALFRQKIFYKNFKIILQNAICIIDPNHDMFESKSGDILLKNTIDNNKLLKCNLCTNEDSFISLHTIFESLYDTFEDILRNPTDILIQILSRIINNEGLSFNEEELASLFNPCNKEDDTMRILLFYFEKAEIDYCNLYDI